MVVARDAHGQLNLLATDPATGATQKVARRPPPRPVRRRHRAGQAGAGRSRSTRSRCTAARSAGMTKPPSPPPLIDAKQLDVEVTGVTWPMDKPASFRARPPSAARRSSSRARRPTRWPRCRPRSRACRCRWPRRTWRKAWSPRSTASSAAQIEVRWNKPDLKFMAQRVVARRPGADPGQDRAGQRRPLRVGRRQGRHDAAHAGHRQPSAATQPQDPGRARQRKALDVRALAEGAAGGSRRHGGAKVAAPKAPMPSAAARRNTKPWELSIGTLAVDSGAVSYADKARRHAGGLRAQRAQAQARSSWRRTAPRRRRWSCPGGSAPAARIEPGRFGYKGKVVLKPIVGRRAAGGGSLPAHAFKAYYSEAPEHRRAPRLRELPGHGRYAATPAGPHVSLAGDTALDDVRVQQRRADAGAEDESNQLLRWKALSLRGVQVDLAPKARACRRRARNRADRFLRAGDRRSDRPHQSAVLAKPKRRRATPAEATAAAAGGDAAHRRPARPAPATTQPAHAGGGANRRPQRRRRRCAAARAESRGTWRRSSISAR